MEESKKLIICCAVGYMEDRVRLNKLKVSLLDRPFIFFGWIRSRKEKRKVIYPVKHLLVGGGYNNKKLIFYYPMSMIVFFLNFLMIKKTTTVYAVGFDTALPAYLANLLNRRFHYIFDNPDNFSLTYNLKGFFKKVVDKLEDKIAKKAIHHIIPGRSRYPEKNGNEVYVPNFPMESQYQRALEIYQLADSNPVFSNIIKDNRLKIYVNGRMVKERGSQWISNTIHRLDKNKFLFVLVGRIDCNILEVTAQNEDNVIKIDRVPNEEALALYMMTDITLAFYDPILPINRKAEPNKWWDCVKTRTAFVSNKEIETLAFFEDKKACFSIPYNDESALDNLLLNLEANRKLIIEIENNLANISGMDWKQMIMDCLNESDYK